MAEKARKATEYAAIARDRNRQATRKRQEARGRRRAFVAPKEHIRADRRYAPFRECFVGADGIEYGYRTDLNIIGLQLFNSRIAKNAAVGRNKRAVVRALEAGLT